MTRIEGYRSYSCREQVRPQASNKQNKTTLASSTFHQQRRLLLLMRIALSVTRNRTCRGQNELWHLEGARGVRGRIRLLSLYFCLHRHANTGFSSGKYMAPNCNAVTLLYLRLVFLTSKETYGVYTHRTIANFHHTRPRFVYCWNFKHTLEQISPSYII